MKKSHHNSTGAANKKQLKRRPGRPRSEQARDAILRSTLRLLQSKGFLELSIEAIAEDAGVSKATVYRWWSSKAELVADAFSESADSELQFPDTGSVRRDMNLQMRRLIRIFRSPRGKIVAAMLGAGQSDPDLIRAFRERFLWPRRRQAYQTLERGIRRGEIRPSADLDLALDSLYGPIYMRFLIGHDDLNESFVDELCRIVLRGLQP